MEKKDAGFEEVDRFMKEVMQEKCCSREEVCPEDNKVQKIRF